MRIGKQVTVIEVVPEPSQLPLPLRPATEPTPSVAEPEKVEEPVGVPAP